MTPTADDVWAWLRVCLDCGKPHESRPVGDPTRWARTWADPVDGHSYHRRGLHWDIDRLQAEFEQAIR